MKTIIFPRGGEITYHHFCVNLTEGNSVFNLTNFLDKSELVVIYELTFPDTPNLAIIRLVTNDFLSVVLCLNQLKFV